MGEHVAPVIVVLDEVALRETVAECIVATGAAQRANGDRWNLELAARFLNSLYAHAGNTCFVDGIGRESVGFVALPCQGPGIRNPAKRRPGFRRAAGQIPLVDVAIETVIGEVLVEAQVPLRAVARARGSPGSGIYGSRIASQLSSSAAIRVHARIMHGQRRRGIGNFYRIGCENLRSNRRRIRSFGPGDNRWILKGEAAAG